MTLTTILKKEAENEDERAEYFRVIKFVKAIQKAPKKIKNTPVIDTSFDPNGSAEIKTPKKPKQIAVILIILMFSSKKK
jgi:hypothetical protein